MTNVSQWVRTEAWTGITCLASLLQTLAISKLLCSAVNRTCLHAHPDGKQQDRPEQSVAQAMSQARSAWGAKCCTRSHD